MNNNGTIALETDRLLLRRFVPEDIEQSFHNWASDVNSSTYFACYPHREIADTEKMLSDWMKSYEDNCTYIWAIEAKEDKTVIGNITANASYPSLEMCEIGYILGSAWWNKGYAREALEEVLNYLFLHEGFYLVEAKYNITNTASGKLLNKVGMRQDGILRDRRRDKITGERNDLVICSMLKREYEDKRACGKS